MPNSQTNPHLESLYDYHVVNLRDARTDIPHNGNNGNYDTAVLVVNSTEYARSRTWFSDFGDPSFDALIAELDFLNTTDLADTDMVSTVEPGSCWANEDPVGHLGFAGHNFEEAANSGCRYFTSVGALRASTNRYLTTCQVFNPDTADSPTYLVDPPAEPPAVSATPVSNPDPAVDQSTTRAI